MEQKEKITTDFRLPDKPLFARSDLLQTLQLQYPDYDKNTFSWIISKMLATKYLYRLGFDLYSKRKPLVYQGGRPDPLVEKVRSFVLKCDDLGTVVVYDSMFLNEWVNELIAHGTVIVEIDRRNMSYAFELLKNHFHKVTVLLNPSVEERTNYAKGDTIAVIPLGSRPPMLLGNGKMCLEKLAVDVFSDRALRLFFSLDETSKMVESMLSAYSYNKRVLIGYAKRRNVLEEIQEVIASSNAPAIKFIEE